MKFNKTHSLNRSVYNLLYVSSVKLEARIYEYLLQKMAIKDLMLIDEQNPDMYVNFDYEKSTLPEMLNAQVDLARSRTAKDIYFNFHDDIIYVPAFDPDKQRFLEPCSKQYLLHKIGLDPKLEANKLIPIKSDDTGVLNPFICDLCQKTFSQEDMVKQHVLNHKQMLYNISNFIKLNKRNL